MQRRAITITPRSGIRLTSRMGKSGTCCNWRVRRSAIALARENPHTRLVFPTMIDPNNIKKTRNHR